MKKRILVILAIGFPFAIEPGAAQAKAKTEIVSPHAAFLHEWKLLGTETQKLRVEILRLAPVKGEVLPPYRVRLLNGSKVLYSKDELGMEPLYIMNIDKDKLMIVWRSYSPFLFVRIFRFHDDKIVMVLKAGSRFYPEVVYPAESSENSTQNLDARIITLTQADFVEKKYVPMTAIIYKWNREKFSYDDGTSVDWNKRLLMK